MNTKEHKPVTVLNQALKLTVQSTSEEALRMREPMLGDRTPERSARESDSNEDPALANVTATLEKHVSLFPRPAWAPDIKENLFLAQLPDSIASERFRSLRTRMLRMRESRPLQTILIVSARAGEGKSLIAANLAQVMAAHASDRVLLIDGDLRRPRLHQILGAPVSPGLHECLSGDAKYVTSVQQSPMDRFYFLPAGDCGNRSAGLIGGSAFEDLLIQLRRGFEWILIDSPAALPVSDAAVLAEYCDGVVVVARSGVVRQQELKQVCEQFESGKILGVVLNGKQLEKKDSYAYHQSGEGRRNK